MKQQHRRTALILAMFIHGAFAVAQVQAPALPPGVVETTQNDGPITYSIDVEKLREWTKNRRSNAFNTAHVPATTLEPLGYGPDGNNGVRYLGTDFDEQNLRALADAGDAGAAQSLWRELRGTERKKASRKLALQQWRMHRHTYLIAEEGRFAEGDVDAIAAGIWFSVAELLGDPIAAIRKRRLRGFEPDMNWASVEKEARRIVDQELRRR
jgi:hypothetical protein